MLEFYQSYGIDGYNKAKSLREEVFIKEQGYSCDFDEHDGQAWHIIGYDGDTLIGTARLNKLSDTVFKIDRVAVKKEYRRSYVGDLMMKTLQDKVVTLGGIEVVVSVEANATDFFTYEGYKSEGDIYTEDNKERILMRKDLSKPTRSCHSCK